MEPVVMTVFSLLVSGFLAIMAICPHHPEKHATVVFTVASVGMFGCGLGMVHVQTQQIIWSCVGLLFLLIIGRWLMRATSEEHLRLNAHSFVAGNYTAQ